MKKKISIIMLITLCLLTTGCGTNKYIKDSEGNVVKLESTGQMLQKNILCKPHEGTELYEKYLQYNDNLDYKLEELPVCDDFNVNSNKANDIWQAIFVKPTAYLIIRLGNIVNNLGISVILIGLFIRIVLLPLTIKSLKQSQNMKKAMPEIQKLEKKYKDKTDRDSMMAKSQEQMMIYKKYKVSPTLGCVLSFIQLPIFFAFLEAIYRVPTIYEQSLFGWNLGTTPIIGIKSGNYTYIILLVLIAISTFFSFRYSMSQNKGLNPENEKQTNMMMNIMTIFIIYASFSLPTAIGLYWIVTYAFISLQTLITNKYVFNKEEKKGKKESKKIVDKLKKKEGMKYGKNN